MDCWVVAPESVAMSVRRSALVVDDEDDIAELVRERLEAQGFHPIWTAGDGESAIAIVYKHEPDLVVPDYMMPGMDGEAVAKALRLLAPKARILLFSTVLHEQPTWADAYLDKAELEGIPIVATQLVSPDEPTLPGFEPR